MTCFIFTSWLDKDFEVTGNIWHKLKKNSKIGQDFKKVISSFVWFWQVLPTFNFGNKHWGVDYVSTHISHFSSYSLFPTILTLKSFCNSCVDSDISKIIKNAKLWQVFSENFLLLSTLPMMIHLSGQSINFGSKMLVRWENN